MYDDNNIFAKILRSEIPCDIVYEDERGGDVKHSLADLSKTKDLLGYKPEYNLKKGLEKTIQFYKNIMQ